MPEKGRKDCPTPANMPVKGGEIEVNSLTRMDRKRPTHSIEGNIMGGTGKKSEKDDGKPKKPPPAPVEDDDYEDGDIATPKRDRHGDDDQPL
jgi:hypothetical protein